MLFSQTTPDEHSMTPPLSRWPVLIILPPLAKLQLVWRRLCDVVRFPSCLFEHTSVYHPSISLVVNIRFVHTFFHPLKLLYICDQNCMVFKSDWNSTAWMSCLVRRADPLFLCPASLLPSFLPPLLRPICLASFFLPCLTSFTVPRFYPPSLSPHRPSSISPLHPGGSGRDAKQAAPTLVIFYFSIWWPLVSYSVCQPLPRQGSNEESPEKLFLLRSSIRRLKPPDCFV